MSYCKLKIVFYSSGVRKFPLRILLVKQNCLNWTCFISTVPSLWRSNLWRRSFYALTFVELLIICCCLTAHRILFRCFCSKHAFVKFQTIVSRKQRKIISNAISRYDIFSNDLTLWSADDLHLVYFDGKNFADKFLSLFRYYSCISPQTTRNSTLADTVGEL